MRLLGVILFIFILILSCKKKDTVWSTDWNAPIINDTLTLEELVNDSTIQEYPGGYYHLGLNRLIFELDINDIVEIEDTTIVETYSIAFANLTITPGFSFVNSTEEHDLNLPSVQLRNVILKEGQIDLKVKNPIATKAIFNVKLPGVSKDGVPFEYEFSAPAGTNANPGIAIQTIDLAGYQIDLTGINGNSFNKLQSLIKVTSDPLGPSVNMTNQDITVVEATFHDVEVAYARGYFGDQVVSDTTDFYLDLLDIYNSGSIDLPNTSVIFEVENGMKLSGEGELTKLSGTNSAGNVVNLSGSYVGSSFNVDPATGGWGSLAPSSKSLTFSSGNSNVEQFIENLSSTVNLGYRFQLNPWGNISGGWDEVFPESRVRVRLKVDMPLQIGMDNLVLQDTFALDVNAIDKGTRITSGELIVNTSNAFPVGAEINLMLLDASGTVIHTIAGGQSIEASQFGVYNPVHNLFVAQSEVHFTLTEAGMNALEEADKIVVRAKLNTTDPGTGMSQQMYIPIGAFLAIKMRVQFTSENVL